MAATRARPRRGGFGRSGWAGCGPSGQFGPGGVRVNAISPGVVRTPGPNESEGPGEHPAEAMMHGTPAGGSGTADAIAHAAVYLASDEATFVHGSVIDVDGGRVGVAVIAA